MLNEYCANQEHVKKAEHAHVVKVANMKLEIPLCNDCFQMLATGKFVRYP